MFDTILGEEDAAVVLEWMRGRLTCSLEEWNWCRFVLDMDDEDDKVNF